MNISKSKGEEKNQLKYVDTISLMLTTEMSIITAKKDG